MLCASADWLRLASVGIDVACRKSHTWHWPRCLPVCKCYGEFTNTFDHILYDTKASNCNPIVPCSLLCLNDSLIVIVWPQLSCSAARVIQRGQSDHYPVVATLHWRHDALQQQHEAARRLVHCPDGLPRLSRLLSRLLLCALVWIAARYRRFPITHRPALLAFCRCRLTAGRRSARRRGLKRLGYALLLAAAVVLLIVWLSK